VIRVLVVDDHTVVREGLRALLTSTEDLECVGTAVDGNDGLQQAQRLRPDVLLLDLPMPSMDGISVIRSLRAEGSAVRVLVFSSYGDSALVLEALQAGADGYLLKQAPDARLLEAIHVVAAGGGVIDPQIVPSVLAGLRKRDAEVLTEREREVLELLRQGHTNRTIARRLQIAEGTVKTHVNHILHRVGAADRTQAALWAERNLRRFHRGSPADFRYPPATRPPAV
jgi:DNA-binding NarL/FixJ family response regulator